MSVGLSLLCGVSVAAEPSPGGSPQRVTPAGGLFSIEFPAAPTCDSNTDEQDCHYVYPSEGWILSASLSKVDPSGPPAESLQKQLATSAEDGSFRIVHQQATRVGDLPALDYRFESTDESVYRAVGRLVLIGARIVTIEVGGDTLPSEDAIQHFMNTFRVEGQPGKSEAVASPAPEPSVQPAQASSAPVQPESSPPSITARMQASLLKPGALQYQSIQEKLPGEGMPWSFSVGTAKRTIQRKRDKKRDALIITEKGRTPAGTFEHRFWLDAKTLLPYRWTSRSPGASTRLEVIDGFLRAEGKGAGAVKLNQHVGDTPLLFPGAPLELALSTLPLAPGFTGSVRVLDPGGMATGKPFSTWRVSVPFAGPVTGLARLKKDVASYKVELLESTEETEQEKAPRKIILWIESEARRVLQVETEAPLSRGGIRSVQTIQTQR